MFPHSATLQQTAKDYSESWAARICDQIKGNIKIDIRNVECYVRCKDNNVPHLPNRFRTVKHGGSRVIFIDTK